MFFAWNLLYSPQCQTAEARLDENCIPLNAMVYTCKSPAGKFHQKRNGGLVVTRDLEDKVAIITGGTSGIGRETAVLFAQAGAKVVVAGRREREGEETVQMVRKAGGEGIFVKTDVARSADVQALVNKTVEKYGRLDTAFNNAGIEGNWAPIAEQGEKDWDSVIDINLKGVWLCLKYELRQMLKQGGGGTIVNMSSVAGLMGAASAAPYVASKHGVIGLTRTAALENASKQIRVNAVCPAVIESPMEHRLFGAPDVHEYMMHRHPIGRIGKPSEIAEAVLWLASEKSSFMTGHYIVLDGGFLVGPEPQEPTG
jgi:NAD(P)-dependent dehydrogenase (short-subunit alcohol dehydrogenase family)